MKKYVYTIYLAGYPVKYRFLFDDTRYYFGLKAKPDNNNDADLSMTQEYFQECRRILGDSDPDAYVEYKGLISMTSQYLLRYSCCIFHAVSLIYKGYTWLLAGPSGTGKTTQYLNWKSMYPDEISMLCGDMPVLKKKDKKLIYVHPSPWNGKEDIGSNHTAPLGGIIFLKQGKVNHIESLSLHDSIVPVFKQFRCIKETQEDIAKLSEITESILLNYPVWKFTNLGNFESTGMIRDYINQYYKQRGIL